MRKILGASALALTALAMPMASHADSNFTTGAGTITASAHLNFTIVIPQFVYARVSTAPAFPAAGIAIDTITYTVPAASVGQGPFTGTGGDLTGGVVTAQVIGNGGTVTFTSTTTGALADGVAGQTISYGQITTTAAADAPLSATLLPHPTLVDGGTTSETLGATAGVTNEAAKWTFTYANANIVAAGTYGATTANNGQVTYTASMP